VAWTEEITLGDCLASISRVILMNEMAVNIMIPTEAIDPARVL